MTDLNDQGSAEAATLRELVELLMELFPSVEELRRFMTLSPVCAVQAHIKPGSLNQGAVDLVVG